MIQVVAHYVIAFSIDRLITGYVGNGICSCSSSSESAAFVGYLCRLKLLLVSSDWKAGCMETV